MRALATENRLATCEIVALELLYSARGVADYEQRWVDRQGLPWLHVTQARPGPATANSDDQVRFAHPATRRPPGPRESGWDVFRHVPAYDPLLAPDWDVFRHVSAYVPRRHHPAALADWARVSEVTATFGSVRRGRPKPLDRLDRPRRFVLTDLTVKGDGDGVEDGG